MSLEKQAEMSSPKMVSEIKQEQEHPSSIFEINEKSLIRKIDYHIVPLMFLCYLMQFLDKVLINVRLLSLALS